MEREINREKCTMRKKMMWKICRKRERCIRRTNMECRRERKIKRERCMRSTNVKCKRKRNIKKCMMRNNIIQKRERKTDTKVKRLVRANMKIPTISLFLDGNLRLTTGLKTVMILMSLFNHRLVHEPMKSFLIILISCIFDPSPPPRLLPS